MDEIHTITRPRFKLDIKKYMRLLNSADFTSNLSKPLNSRKTDFLSDYHRHSNSTKFEKFTGNLHFHHDTLRHTKGEFPLNLILATPKQILKPEVSLPTKKKLRNKSLTSNAASIKNLIKKASTILERKRYSIGTNPQQKPRTPNSQGFHVKSRTYLKRVYNETLV